MELSGESLRESLKLGRSLHGGEEEEGKATEQKETGKYYITGSAYIANSKMKLTVPSSQPDSARSYDTCSDNDVDEFSNIVADSQRSINSVDTRRSNLEEDGFVKDDHHHEYVSLNIKINLLTLII